MIDDNKCSQPRVLKGDDISERLLTFSVRIIKLFEAISKTRAGRHIAGQIVRSGTSAGANYEEARGAESRIDFIHKLGVCLKEIRETLYWLRLIERAELMASNRMGEIICEADELARIIAKSIQSAKTKINGKIK